MLGSAPRPLRVAPNRIAEEETLRGLRRHLHPIRFCDCILARRVVVVARLQPLGRLEPIGITIMSGRLIVDVLASSCIQLRTVFVPFG